MKREAKEQTTHCGAAFFDGLVEQAAGYDAAKAAFGETVEGLAKLGANDESAVSALVLEYGQAVLDNGFNAGFELGFQQGALLALYGKKAE